MQPYNLEGKEATSRAWATQGHPQPVEVTLNLKVWDEYNLEVKGEGN